jgi:hypothetical protein
MRKTGRTFRALLRALNLASEGKHVVYVSHSNNVTDCNFNISIRIASNFMKPETLGMRILKIGSGTIRFTGRLSEVEISSMKRSDNYELVIDN